jgi:putative PEP-CTERM system TPR-repeat lipoprotein
MNSIPLKGEVSNQQGIWMNRPRPSPKIPAWLRKPALIAAISLALSMPGFANTANYSEDARLLFQQKDYKAALIQLKNALKKNPKDLPSRILMARTFLAMKKGALAEHEINLALDQGADLNIALPLLAKAYFLQGKVNEIIQDPRARRLEDAERAEFLFVQGQAYLELKQLDQAEQAFAEAGGLAPAKADPLLGQARVMLGRDQPDLAEDLTDKATALEPDYVDGWFLKGELRRHKGDLEGAIQQYNKALKQEKDHTEALIGRAMCLLGLKREREALADANAVIKLAPYHTGAVYLKLVIALRLGDRDAVRQAIQEANDALNRLKPEFISSHPPSLLLKGLLRYHEKHYEGAQAAFSEYLQMEPNNAMVRKLLAEMLLLQGRLDDAIEKLKPVVASSPDDEQAYLMLGDAYRRRGKLGDAAELLEKGVKALPKSAAPRLMLAQTRLDLGDIKEAQAQTEKVLAEHPDNAAAGLLLTEIELRQGEYDKALKRSQALAKQQPNSPSARNLLGVAHSNKGDPAAARADFERALALDAHFTPALRNLAKLDMQQGRLAAAEANFKKLLEKAPDDFQALQQLSIIAEKGNRLEEAVSWLEKIPANTPEGIAAQARLVDLYLRLNNKGMAVSTAERLYGLDQNNFAVLIALATAKLAQGKREEAANLFYTKAVRFSDSAEKSHAIAKVLMAAQDLGNARLALLRAIKANPEYLPAQVDLVGLEMERNQNEEALRVANQIREHFPKSPVGDLLAGDVLMRLKRPGEAAQAYRAGQAKEDSVALAVRVYQAAKEADGPDKALSGLEQWTKANPKAKAVQHMLAIGYLDAGHYDQAVTAHEAVLKAEPESPDLLNNLAWLYQRKGDARALEYAEKAYRLAPANPAILDTLGWIHMQKGDAANALTYLREAQTRAANSPSIRYHLSAALHQLGRNDEAQQQLAEALKSSVAFDGRDQAQALMEQLSKK